LLVADLDPQANLTAAFLEDDRLEQLWPEGHTLLPCSVLLSLFSAVLETYSTDHMWRASPVV
jgi:hypothetical protein